MRGFARSPMKGNRVNPYLIEISFESNNTSAPDGVSPDYGSDLAVARTGTGTFTITFAGTKKPYRAKVLCFTEDDDANLFVKGSYVHSTGVVTLKTYVNSGGTIAAADTTDKTICVWLLCTDSSEGDTVDASA